MTPLFSRKSIILDTIKAIFSATIAFSLGGTAHAQPQSRPIPEKIIRVATRHFLPPYVYENAESGIEIDLVKAVFKESNFGIEFVQLPRIRMISSFEDNQLDGILTQNVKASNVGCATKWYIEHQNVALTVGSRQLKVDTLNDLSNFAVISFSGATRYLGKTFSDAVQLSRRYTESGDQGTHISLLYKGRFDVAVGDNWILRLAQKRHLDQTGEYMALDTHKVMPASHYVARFHDQEMCDAFDTALDKIRDNGAYNEIWASYRARIYVEAGMKPAPLP